MSSLRKWQYGECCGGISPSAIAWKFTVADLLSAISPLAASASRMARIAREGSTCRDPIPKNTWTPWAAPGAGGGGDAEGEAEIKNLRAGEATSGRRQFQISAPPAPLWCGHSSASRLSEVLRAAQQVAQPSSERRPDGDD